MIKGKNQHVIPDNAGWCVIDEANQQVIQHFDTQQEALNYAQQCAQHDESEVLVHATACEPSELSTVTLPQREFIPGKGHTGHLLGEEQSKTKPVADQEQSNASDFDPLLGYDESYFDL